MDSGEVISIISASPPNMHISVFKFPRKASISKADSGAALVVVLVLLVLMLGVILAFFSQSILQRQISKSSASQTMAELMADGAVNTIIGDLKEEISVNSEPAVEVSTSSGIVKLYRPKGNNYKYAAPTRVGTTDDLPNLVKRSVRAGSDDSNFADGVPSRAATLSTYSANPSLKERVITPARWNKPLLMEAGTDFATPSASFTPPDWILVDRSGNNPKSWDPVLASTPNPSSADGGNAVVGRYAYTIYNEGGLLDANVAGYSSDAKGKIEDNTDEATKYKNSLSYADLTTIDGFDQTKVDTLVNWRNGATLKGTGTPAANYYEFATRNSDNFLTTSNTSTNGGTDHMFLGRQQLIDFFKNKLGAGSDKKMLNALQYFGTFSRVLNQPSLFPVYDGKGESWNRPKVVGPRFKFSDNPKAFLGGNSGQNQEDLINPIFRKIRVGNDGFLKPRNDGSKAIPGEPLVKRRFPLDHLCWITYKGPIATLSGDPIWDAYKKLGVSEELLKNGTQENITKYFGLEWVPSQGGYWIYKHDFPGTIGVFEDVAKIAKREPDFFEILKAAISVGSIGRARTEGGETGENTAVGRWQAVRDSSINHQILQLGANIIDAAAPDSYTTNIVWTDDGGVVWPFWGRVDLPYLYSLGNSSIVANVPDPAPPIDASPERGASADSFDPNSAKMAGKGVVFSVPTIWNPNRARPVLPLQKLDDALVPSELRICASVYPYDLRPSNITSVRMGNGAEWSNSKVIDPITGNLYNQGNSYQQKFPTSPDGAFVRTPWVDAKYDGVTGKMSFPENCNFAINFRNDPAFYREPTPLWRKDAAVGPKITVENGYFKNDITEPSGKNKFAGFLLMEYKIRVKEMPSPPVATNPPTVYTMNNIWTVNVQNGVQLSLEYKRDGQWIPYCQSSIRPNFASFRPGWGFDETAQSYYNQSFETQWGKNIKGDSPPLPTDPNWGRNNYNLSSFDPRGGSKWITPKDYATGAWLDAAHTTIKSMRPTNIIDDENRGYTVGASATNRIDDAKKGQFNPFYKDSDGIVRRAMSGYTTLSSSGFHPLCTPADTEDKKNARPIMLNRPFRNVGELSYVFRDTPWKNIDFSTPESGDSPLLDAFCIHESNRSDALMAGKVDLNTGQWPVIKSILTGAYRDEFKAAGSNNVMDSVAAEKYARALVARTGNTTTSNLGPLYNIGDCVGRYISEFKNTTAKGNGQSYDGFSADLVTGSTSEEIVQRFRETTIRALSDTGMAGTWNLLIDVVAQSGRYPTKASKLSDFQVEGEKRLWVHVAIDRQTGQVIDQQIEGVKE